jgi:hypothetical protein
MKTTREMRDNNGHGVSLLAAVSRLSWGATDLMSYERESRASIIRARLVLADLRALFIRQGDKSMRFGMVTELRAGRDTARRDRRAADSYSSRQR